VRIRLGIWELTPSRQNGPRVGVGQLGISRMKLRRIVHSPLKRRARNPRRNNRASLPPQNSPPTIPLFPRFATSSVRGTRMLRPCPAVRRLISKRCGRRSMPCVRKCGGLIPPAEVRRVDFERIECPVCGERFAPSPRRREENNASKNGPTVL
jgi:hypothetical protein